MKEKTDFGNVIKKFIPKELDIKDLKIEVKVRKPKLEINVLDKNGRILFWGMSKTNGTN